MGLVREKDPLCGGDGPVVVVYKRTLCGSSERAHQNQQEERVRDRVVLGIQT